MEVYESSKCLVWRFVGNKFPDCIEGFVQINRWSFYIRHLLGGLLTGFFEKSPDLFHPLFNSVLLPVFPGDGPVDLDRVLVEVSSYEIAGVVGRESGFRFENLGLCLLNQHLDGFFFPIRLYEPEGGILEICTGCIVVAGLLKFVRQRLQLFCNLQRLIMS